MAVAIKLPYPHLGLAAKPYFEALYPPTRGPDLAGALDPYLEIALIQLAAGDANNDDLPPDPWKPADM